MALGKEILIDSSINVGYWSFVSAYIDKNGSIAVIIRGYENEQARIDGDSPVIPMKVVQYGPDSAKHNELLTMFYGLLKELPMFEGALDLDPDLWKEEPVI